jgi:hypothetical protein
MHDTQWWEKRWFLALLLLFSALPLLWPETPPLVDVPGHMARYRVQLELGHSAELQRYFEFHWALIGNLGVDLLVVPLERLVGLEAAVKIIVLCIPPFTVAGLLWVAKEVHGQIPPTALFAIPFIYGYPFNFGFINFALSVALALVAFGLWLHLTNAGRVRLRTWLFIPISCAVWMAHAFGWGILGLLAFSSEIIRRQDDGMGWRRSSAHAARSVIPLALPLVLMVIWRSGDAGGKTGHFFEGLEKLFALVAALRDRWLIWDSFGVGVALVLLGASVFDGRLEMSRRLGFPAAVLALTFVVMPALVFGSAYADMRLAPVMLMIAILAVRVRPQYAQIGRTIAWLGLVFVALRLGGNAISFAIADRQARTWLTALDSIPRGSPVLTLAGEFCLERWEMPRNSHLGSFNVIRNRGFSNDQWQGAGAQLMRINYPKAGFFADDRSTFVYSEDCIRRTEAEVGRPLAFAHTAETALQKFPRAAFDYVWIIDPLDFDMKARPGLMPIWRADRSVLYRVDHNYRRASDGSALPATTGSRCVEYAAKEGGGKCWRNPK